MSNPCENCIYNVDEYCRCEKLTVYETYHQACEDMLEKFRDIMTFHQKGLGGYFTISQDEWHCLEEKIND